MQASLNSLENDIRKLSPLGRDFSDAYNDMHVIAGKEPIAKRNCFGRFVSGTFASKQGERPSAINSIDVGTVDVL